MLKKLVALLIALGASSAAAAQSPTRVQADFVLKDFKFSSGETLPELRVHYETLGTPRRDEKGIVRNAVLILHGTGSSGSAFISAQFGRQLFGDGALLDASRYFIILPDGVGHGQSSKPSDGLRTRFPRYRYQDMVEAQYRLVTEGLGVNHLRLVMGTSMGGMHTWLWGETYPDFMDALMPLASLPVQIAGLNQVTRRMTIDAIRTDPEWQNGDYKSQPHGLYAAIHIRMIMTSSPLQWQKQYPTREGADKFLEDTARARFSSTDANDMLYQLEASSDYDPSPRLERIKAPLTAVNSDDDLINPPQLRILEREITRVAKGRAVVLPISDETRGHSTHSIPSLWNQYLRELLATSGE
jgi:homoserine O-acetyltransferase/O-succinyltransferase